MKHPPSARWCDALRASQPLGVQSLRHLDRLGEYLDSATQPATNPWKLSEKQAAKGGLIVLGLILFGVWACNPSTSPEEPAEKRETKAEARGEKKAQQVIAAGDSHMCSLGVGTVSCWGSNEYGQLGNTKLNGTNRGNPKPTPVAGLTNVTAITAGTTHTCALADGAVSCWGLNEYGELGNNTNSGTDTANPTPNRWSGSVSADIYSRGCDGPPRRCHRARTRR